MADMGRTMAPGRIRQRVGPTLRAMRIRRGLSVLELAELAGISSSHLSRIERGLAVPSYDVLDKIATAVGSDLTSLRVQERTAKAVDLALDSQLASWGVSAEARQDMLDLQDETRRELAELLPKLQFHAAASSDD